MVNDWAYSTLELPVNSSLREIKAAYRKLSLKYHPDKSKETEFVDKFDQIVKAYNYLISRCKNKEPKVKQLQSNEITLDLTLEELFHGCTKNVTITRTVIDESGASFKEDQVLPVEVPPGTLDATKIVLPGQGDKEHGKLSANVVVTIHEIAHSAFKRVRHIDLEHVVQIGPDQLFCSTVSVRTIENETMQIRVKKPITKSTIIKVPNKGFPIIGKEKQRGDLELKFNIIYGQPKIQDPAIEHDLYLTLEQIFKGCQKKMKITREIHGKLEEKIVCLDVKRGTEAGTRFTFPREGDQIAGHIPADIVFVAQLQPHQAFVRKGADIEYVAKITPSEAIIGGDIQIPSLDSSKPFCHKVKGGITVNSVKRIPNRGLPHMNDPTRFGDLVLRFEIVFEEIQLFQDPPIERDLELTLEEIFSGCQKKVNISKKVNEEREEKCVSIDVKRGTEEGTQFVFPREGDQKDGTIPADVVFIARIQRHKTFVQKGAHIEYVAKISPKEAIMGGEIEIPTLDGKSFKHRIMGGITPNSEERIPNRGLPHCNDPKQFGDLVLRFEIMFEEEKKLPQDPPIEHDFTLTLEQVFKGCQKKVKISRKINGRADEKIVTIDVRPGTEEGTRFTFPQEGDQNKGRIPADIVFVAHVQPHDTFVRTGAADIEYVAKITTKEAILGGEIEVPTLAGTTIKHRIKGGITPGSTIRIPNRGLPHLSDPKQLGDLVLRFEIVFEEEKKLTQDPPVKHDLKLTLEEIYNGCQKKVRISRKINGKTEDKVLTVDVKPGTESGTCFTFAQEGDQYVGTIPADIVLVVQIQPHETFVQKGVDLEYVAAITPKEAIMGGEIEIPTLGGKPFKHRIKGGISPDSEERIPNRGLPHLSDPKRFGDLVLRFEIVFEEKPLTQDPPVEHDFELTLHDILNGCLKSVKIHRKINGQYEEKMLTVDVKPGTKAGTRFTFPREGDRNKGSLPADIVLVAHVQPHKKFVPKGVDIEFTAEVRQSALNKGDLLEVPTLDGETKSFKLDTQITDNSVHKIKNYGLPYPNDPRKRGDFFVRLKVIQDINLVDQSNSGKSEFNLRICHKCGKEVNGGCVYQERAYHYHCFACFKCDKEIRGQFYMKDNKPVCQECYVTKIAEKCCVCHKAVLDQISRALGKIYHPNCFACVVCKKSLAGQAFKVDESNQIYCKDDYNEKYSPRCFACNKFIVPEQGQTQVTRVLFDDKSFHESCYKCKKCGHQFLKNDRTRRSIQDGKILCQSCF